MRTGSIATIAGIVAAAGLLFGACSTDQSPIVPDDLIPGDAASGDAAGPDGGAGTGGSGGTGGTGGTPEAPEGIPASDTVSGGALMTSDNFTLVLTTGQSPGGNGILRSTNYRLQTGVIGVTQ
jgi:hypothetical protein